MIDWAVRQQEHREEEWKTRTELLDLACEAIRRWKDSARIGNLEGIARLLELASKLGRLSSGMPTDSTETAVEVDGALDINWELAISRIYGAKPAQVIDVQSSPSPAGSKEKEPGAMRYRAPENSRYNDLTIYQWHIASAFLHL